MLNLLCNVIKIFEKYSAFPKATPGRSVYSPALYRIKSATAKLLSSFRCQVKIRVGQDEETALRYGGGVVGGGAGVESGEDSLNSSVYGREWKVAEECESRGESKLTGEIGG